MEKNVIKNFITLFKNFCINQSHLFIIKLQLWMRLQDSRVKLYSQNEFCVERLYIANHSNCPLTNPLDRHKEIKVSVCYDVLRNISVIFLLFLEIYYICVLKGKGEIIVTKICMLNLWLCLIIFHTILNKNC